ncbi:hypothetical protein PVAP13_6NG193303 [Panicum virgatum]|uniref:Uncharacterized protein n=1 Tax=Panicum virgatum TaxID=38727 RepID=A0A8T0QWH1_PANVG|nr:hypothetical protein PVAP13_6NG193303 [Panicum virgatum]
MFQYSLILCVFFRPALTLFLLTTCIFFHAAREAPVCAAAGVSPARAAVSASSCSQHGMLPMPAPHEFLHAALAAGSAADARSRASSIYARGCLCESSCACGPIASSWRLEPWRVRPHREIPLLGERPAPRTHPAEDGPWTVFKWVKPVPSFWTNRSDLGWSQLEKWVRPNLTQFNHPTTHTVIFFVCLKESGLGTLNNASSVIGAETASHLDI